MFCVQLAGIVIEIDNRYEHVHRICKDYIVEGKEPSFTVHVTEEEILAEPASQACQLPQWLREGNYEIEWHIDVKSLLQYYSNIFNMAGLQRLTGINQKQLHHYASGLSKPRPTQRARINEALHRLGQELLTLNI